jgi:cell division protein FtsB
MSAQAYQEPKEPAKSDSKAEFKEKLDTLLFNNEKLKKKLELATKQLKATKQVHFKEIKKLQDELENAFIEYRSKDKE